MLNEMYVIGCGLNVDMHRFGILLRIQKVPSSNLGSRADYTDFSSSMVFLNAPREIFLSTSFPVHYSQLMRNSTL
jgi:hypothetical protein